jgi:hypothetical protein
MFDISTSSFFGQHKKVISAISWREQTCCLGNRILCPSGTTCLQADCCFSELSPYNSNSACWCSCRSLCVLLSFFLWPFFGLCFFDLRILITPLVSSNSSYIYENFSVINVKCSCSISGTRRVTNQVISDESGKDLEVILVL